MTESTNTPRQENTTRPQMVPGVAQLALYKMGKSQLDDHASPIKLSSNESALGTSPAAIAAFTSVQDRLHRYPDGAQTELRAAIADTWELDPERILCGNGSEELIGFVIRCFMADGDELLLSENHFEICRNYALSVGGQVVTAPEKDFVTDVDALLERVGPHTRVVALANPNNPTGTYVNAQEIRRLHQALPADVVLLLDGAYAEYVTADDFEAGASLVDENDNVVMTRSFSKLYGLAGLRIGWAYGSQWLVDALQRIRVPFNANAAAMAAAAAAVRDSAWLTHAREHNARWQARIAGDLTSLGLHVVPSEANFYLLVFDDCPGKTAKEAAAALEANGIIPRPVGGAAGTDHDVLRITVGNDAENDAALNVLRNYLTA
ncbi:MAG: histidinol-phosphate transaminase [Chromatiales bacterium]|nr:MAG: histidinol-phosphate transaminase [Chromatiales bacterium]